MEPVPTGEDYVIYLPKEKATFPLWKFWVTSPPDHMPLSPSPASPSWGVLCLYKCHFHSQSSLTLFVCWIPLPVKQGLWEGDQEVRGVCSWLGGPIHTACRKFCIPLGNGDGGCRGRIQPLDNAVNAERCEPFSQTGQLWLFFSF